MRCCFLVEFGRRGGKDIWNLFLIQKCFVKTTIREQTLSQAQEANRLWFTFNNSLQGFSAATILGPTYVLHPTGGLTQCYRKSMRQENGNNLDS